MKARAGIFNRHMQPGHLGPLTVNGARVISMKAAAISHATEENEKVTKAILQLCPKGFEGRIVAARVKGHHGNEITVFRLHVKGAAKADPFFTHLWSRISVSDRKEIVSKIRSFMDSTGALHIRIDKQESLSGRVLIRDSDPIKVEIQFAGDGLPRESLVEKVIMRMNAGSGRNLDS